MRSIAAEEEVTQSYGAKSRTMCPYEPLFMLHKF